MTFLRAFILSFFVVIAIYSAAVIFTDGIDLITPFFTELFAVNWSGQFNLDFAGYLMLSAFWIVWRHRFSTRGVILAACAGFGGLLIFAPYLLYQMGQSNGSVSNLLLGEQKSSDGL